MSKQEFGLGKKPQRRNQTSTMNVLEKIQRCQREIAAHRSKCDKEIGDLERAYVKTVKPYIKDRNHLILNVPHFWSTVLLQHPLLGSIYEPGEKDVIKYLASVEVEEDPANPDLFKIHFFFQPNPYFENQDLVKQFTEDGSASTTIKWRTSQKFLQPRHEIWEHDELGMEQKGFFRWFCDAKEQFCDPIADILKCQVWFDPLEFYFCDSGDRKTSEH